MAPFVESEILVPHALNLYDFEESVVQRISVPSFIKEISDLSKLSWMSSKDNYAMNKT